MATQPADPTESTVEKQSNLISWQPGQSGNPAGRPKGSRNKLGEEFVGSLQDHFATHGDAAIERLYNSDVAAYMNVIARVIPKEVIHTVREYDDLSDDDLELVARELARRVLGVGEGRRGKRQKALPAPMSDEPPLAFAPRTKPA
jgi:hypothetical protein